MVFRMLIGLPCVKFFQNILALFFCLPTDLNVNISSFSGSPYELPSACNISLSGVKSSLAKLHLTNSVRPDSLSGTFIYNLRSVLCFSLFIIYSKSLSESVFPNIWKISSVIRIFKTGDVSDVVNYKPVLSVT